MWIHSADSKRLFKRFKRDNKEDAPFFSAMKAEESFMELTAARFELMLHCSDCNQSIEYCESKLLQQEVNVKKTVASVKQLEKNVSSSEDKKRSLQKIDYELNGKYHDQAECRQAGENRLCAFYCGVNVHHHYYFENMFKRAIQTGVY